MIGSYHQYNCQLLIDQHYFNKEIDNPDALVHKIGLTRTPCCTTILHLLKYRKLRQLFASIV